MGESLAERAGLRGGGLRGELVRGGGFPGTGLWPALFKLDSCAEISSLLLILIILLFSVFSPHPLTTHTHTHNSTSNHSYQQDKITTDTYSFMLIFRLVPEVGGHGSPLLPVLSQSSTE